MSNIPTPHKFLEAIQRNAFKDIDLTQLLTMDEDQQRIFTLEQMERMLSMPNVYTAEWLSDQFWTADKELIMMYDPHPWLENTRRRLELMYAGCYSWEQSLEGDIYHVRITLKIKD